MSFRLSKYVLSKKINDQEYIALSSITRSTAILPSWILEQPGSIEENSELAKDLINTRFFTTKSHTDEDFSIREFFKNIWGPNGKNLGILLAPTLNCNFACPYCYEHRNSMVMSLETLNNLKRFINNRINSFGTENIVLGCYGGEPLLRPKFFTKLAEHIQKSHPRVNLTMMMVTNGSLLEKSIHLFKDTPLAGIQVTLHGSREFHNKKRTYIDGRPSYDKIISGIKSTLEILPNAHIALRVNLDSQNSESLTDMIADLKSFGIIDNNRVSIHPSFIQSLTGDSTSYECNCIPQPMHYDYMIKWLTELENQGCIKDNKTLKKRYMETFITSPCSSHSYHNFVIAPDGSLGRCWSFVGDIKHSTGNVNLENFFVGDDEKLWYKSGLKRVGKCIDSNCPIVPICGGGCTATSYERKGSIDEPFCIKSKDEMLRFLEKYAEISKRVGLIENKNYSIS